MVNGAFEILPHEAADGALGEAVSRMLDASKEGIRTPDLRQEPSPFSQILAAVGLRSHAGYVRGTRHVHVEPEGSRVAVTPSRNGGSKEGFVGLSEECVVVGGPYAELVGQAVRAAMVKST